MRWLVTLVVGGAVLAPAVLPDARDGFPISTYPMFTADRGRVVELSTVVLVDGAGRHRLSPEEIGGTDEVVLAAVTVRRAIAAGRVGLDRLCAEVTGRVDRPGSIEVVTETLDAVAVLRHGAPPIEVRLHRRCARPGGAG